MRAQFATLSLDYGAFGLDYGFRMDSNEAQEDLLAAAIQSHQTGRLDEAAALYYQILQTRPDDADALHFLGVLLHQRGNSAKGVELMERSIAQRPDIPGVHYNIATAFEELRDPEKAVAHYRRATALNPQYIKALNRLGCIFYDAGNWGEADSCFQKALAVEPNTPELLNNLASVFIEMDQIERATAACQRALTLKPEYAEGHNNLGRIRQREGRLTEAVEHYRAAWRLNPELVAAANNLGGALCSLHQVEESIDVLNAALVKQPDVPEILNNLGNSLLAAGRRKEGVATLRRAVKLAPNNSAFHSNLVHTLTMQPEFSSAAIYEESRRWHERHALPLERLRRPHANVRDAERPLRIGYVSPDFRDHVVGRNLLPLFRHHDQRNFIVTCYSNSHVDDEITKNIRRHSHGWRVIAGIGDESVAELVRKDQIDILVDLALHTRQNRLTVFARKPAPLQMTFAGYPGTTGLSAIDYRLTDPYLDPPAFGDDRYAERSIRLACSFWCYDPLESVVEVNELPALKNGYVTFGCLNNFLKINEVVLRVWAPIFEALPDARLVVLAAKGRHREELAKALRLTTQRVRFVEPCDRERYLQTYHSIDICLDTFPYNGHTTSLDSFWMGVPVITLPGETVASRAGVSQLTNLGYQKFIAHSPEAFVRTVLDVAGDVNELAAIRRELRGRLQNSPLMDAAGFATSIENAYRNAWRRWCETSGV